MKIKNLIWIFVFILSISFTSAIDVPYGGLNFWNFSSTADLWGSSDASNTGCTSSSDYPFFNISGSSNVTSFFCNGDNKFLNLNTDFPNEGSVLFHFKRTSSAVNYVLSSYGGGFNNANGINIHIMSDGTYRVSTGGGTASVLAGTTIETISENNWNCLGFTNDVSDNFKMGINGSFVLNGSWSPGNWNGYNLYINERGLLSGYGTSLYIDHVQIFNRSINNTEFANYCNYGYVDYVEPIEDNFSITLKDFYNNDSLTNFTAYVGDYTFNDNNTGTINTNISIDNSSLFNITIEKFAYFNATYENYNISSSGNLQATIYGSNVTLRIVYNNTNVTANVSNSTLRDLNNSLQWITDTGYFNIYPYPLTPITYNISCNRSVFENRAFTINFTARDTSEYIIYVEPTTNVFYFYDQDTNLSIENATIDITYPSGDTTTKTTDSNGMISFSWINSSLDLDFGNYTFEFDKIGYNIITFIEEINSSNVPLNKSYNISRANLIINIYDRQTGLLLNYTNVTLKLLGVFENVTSTGVFNYTDLSLISQDYTLQALADGFDTEQKSFSFTNQEDLEIDMYLLNTSLSNAGTLFVTSLDEGYFRLQNVQNILQENVAGEWVGVSECFSNSNGECVFSVELGTKLYRVIGYKTIDGVLVTDQTSEFGEFIDIDNDVRTLVLSSFEAFEVSEVNKLIYEIDYTKAYELKDNNNISSVSVDFYRRDGTTITLCVQYYLLNGNSKTNATVEQCNTASSGSVNLGVSYLLNRSNTYSVEVYVKNGQTLLTEIYPKANAVTEALEDISLLKVVLSVIFLALLGISIRTGNAGFFLFGSIILSWVYSAFVPNLWNGFGSVLITVIGVSAFFIIKDKVIKE